MIFIVVKIPVKPEHAENFVETVRPFTDAFRAEPGNLWYEYSRSVEDPNTFVLLEAFEDGAGEAHVNSEHFKASLDATRPLLARQPEIVSTVIEGKNGWDKVAEIGEV